VLKLKTIFGVGGKNAKRKRAIQHCHWLRHQNPQGVGAGAVRVSLSSLSTLRTHPEWFNGLSVEKEKPLPLTYEAVKLECGYRVDLLVENKLIVEVKAVETMHPVHLAQLLTYLKLSDCRLGLLINFNVPLLKDGLKRVIN
jgi:GxxExxY protein